MMAEFLPNYPQHIALWKIQGNGRPVECCLCFQLTAYETMLLLRSSWGSVDYLVCPDCAETFAAEPERAYLEIEEWQSMLEEVNTDA